MQIDVGFNRRVLGILDAVAGKGRPAPALRVLVTDHAAAAVESEHLRKLADHVLAIKLRADLIDRVDLDLTIGILPVRDRQRRTVLTVAAGHVGKGAVLDRRSVLIMLLGILFHLAGLHRGFD